MFFGPGDFSLALGVPGQLQHPDVKAARRRIAEYADMGYNLLSVGADVVALAIYADDSMAAFDKALG